MLIICHSFGVTCKIEIGLNPFYMDVIPSWTFFGMVLIYYYKNPGLPITELSLFGNEERTLLSYLRANRGLPKSQDFGKLHKPV